MHRLWTYCRDTIVDKHPAQGSLGVGSNPGGLILGWFGDTVHRYLPPVGHFMFFTGIIDPPPPHRVKKTLHKEGAYLKCTEHMLHSALRVGGQVRGSLPWRRWGRPCLRSSVRDMNQRTVRAPER